VLVQLTILCGLLLIATLIWGQFDQRTLDGVAVWKKPAKFSVSFLVHFATLAIIVNVMSPENKKLRIVKGVGWLMAAVFVAEMTYLFLQAAQAQHSHFNETTPFHSAMYSLMGVGAVVLIALPVVIARHAKAEFLMQI
jgi:hydrogenase-4 membrane subunit HyfE